MWLVDGLVDSSVQLQLILGVLEEACCIEIGRSSWPSQELGLAIKYMTVAEEVHNEDNMNNIK